MLQILFTIYFSQFAPNKRWKEGKRWNDTVWNLWSLLVMVFLVRFWSLKNLHVATFRKGAIINWYKYCIEKYQFLLFFFFFEGYIVSQLHWIISKPTVWDANIVKRTFDCLDSSNKCEKGIFLVNKRIR